MVQLIICEYHLKAFKVLTALYANIAADSRC